MIEISNIKYNAKHNAWMVQCGGLYLSKATSKISKEDFLHFANDEYVKRFGKEYIGRSIDSDSVLVLDKSIPAYYRQIIQNRWASINQRSSNGIYKNERCVKLNPQHISYQSKDIKLLMTYKDFVDWMMTVKDKHDAIVANGGKSSIDRIDDNKGYSIDNIQMIDLHKNIEKRYNRKCINISEDDKLIRKLINSKSYIKHVKSLIAIIKDLQNDEINLK